MNRTIDVDRVIDDQKVGRLNFILVGWLFLVLAIDGYDMTVPGFAGPGIVHDWGVERASLTPMLSAGLFGILLGAFVFGYLGDRYGRRFGTIMSVTVVGVFTLAIVWAENLTQMTIMRFLGGLGIGGLFPNTIALTAEYAPKRVRAKLIILMFCGTTLGAASPGIVATYLEPIFGFQVLFAVGGIVPLLLAGALFFVLPESVKYLTVRKGDSARPQIARLLSRLDSHGGFDASDRFVSGAGVVGKTQIKDIFQGHLRWGTPLLWIAGMLNLLVFFFLTSWMPTVAVASGAGLHQGVLALSVFALGGTCGGFILSMLMDRRMLMPVFWMLVVSVPAVGLLGYITMASPDLLLVLAFVAGFCQLGAQFGFNAVPGLIYPTRTRATGTGWAIGIGRLGGAIGPIVGGLLVIMNLDITGFYLFAAIPLAIGAVVTLALNRLLLADAREQAESVPVMDEAA